jgi:hypothetical protein
VLNKGWKKKRDENQKRSKGVEDQRGRGEKRISQGQDTKAPPTYYYKK